MTLAEALQRRQTTRNIRAEEVPLELLSNLLWAACGVNRGVGPFGSVGVTAASASNSREVELYVALRGGTWRFDALDHALLPVVELDLRDLALFPGQRQRVTPPAPVELIYVANVERLTRSEGFDDPGLHDPETQKAYYYVDTGMIAANVYLFAAANGLAAWFHHCDRAGLKRALGLRERQCALFAQSVGYPAREGVEQTQHRGLP